MHVNANLVWKSYRRKSTDGVSSFTMSIWAISGCTLGAYNIGLGVAIPLWVQPQLFTFIAYMCLVQEWYYTNGLSKFKSIMSFIAIVIASAAFEVGYLYGFWAAQDNGNENAVRFFGVFPVVTIIVGFVPQFWTIFGKNTPRSD